MRIVVRAVAPGDGLIHFTGSVGVLEIWRVSAGLQINKVNRCGGHAVRVSVWDWKLFSPCDQQQVRAANLFEVQAPY
ncbi:unnamed protein product [Leuciscus chuanchicus]